MESPKSNASAVIELATAISSDLTLWLAGAPFPDSIKSLIRIVSEKQIERGREALEAEIRKGHLEGLTAPQKEAFVPSAFRFFEAARLGEATHNLRILARLMVTGLKSGELDPGEYQKDIRRVEGLSLKEVRTLALIHREISVSKSMEREQEPFFTATYLKERLPDDFVDRGAAAAVLSELLARGLLVPDGATRVGKSEEYYSATTNLERIGDMALAIQENE